jgi:rRNA maturation endonuclease Nob1
MSSEQSAEKRCAACGKLLSEWHPAHGCRMLGGQPHVWRPVTETCS